MNHLAKRIGSDLSKYWNIKNSQNKCANMFNSDWINGGKKIVFHLYPDQKYEFSNGSIIIRGYRQHDAVFDGPSIRLVLNDDNNSIDHAIVAYPTQQVVIEEDNILKTFVRLYGMSYRDVVVFGRKLNLLNVSII